MQKDSRIMLMTSQSHYSSVLYCFGRALRLLTKMFTVKNATNVIYYEIAFCRCFRFFSTSNIKEVIVIFFLKDQKDQRCWRHKMRSSITERHDRRLLIFWIVICDKKSEIKWADFDEKNWCHIIQNDILNQ